MFVIAAELASDRPLFVRDLAAMRTTHVKQLAQQFPGDVLDRIDLEALEKRGFAAVGLEVFGLKVLPSRVFFLPEEESFVVPDRELRRGRPLRLRRPDRQPILPPKGGEHRPGGERKA